MNDLSLEGGGRGGGGEHILLFLLDPWELSLHPHCHTGGNPENFLETLMPENGRNYSIGQFKGWMVSVQTRIRLSCSQSKSGPLSHINSITPAAHSFII
jgi:hypothetical protein